MHEAPIAEGILDVAMDARGRRTGRIARVTVVIGVLAGVEGESLRMYFAQLARGTPAEGAVLDIRLAMAKLICTRCELSVDYDGAGGLAVLCSRCGAVNRLRGGNELYVDSIEVEGDAEDPAGQGDPRRE